MDELFPFPDSFWLVSVLQKKPKIIEEKDSHAKSVEQTFR